MTVAHVKAFVLLSFFAIAIFAALRKPLLAMGVSERDLAIRRNAWIAVTAAAFLSGGFWVFLVLGAGVAFVASRKDSNVIALYVVLLFAGPAFEKYIPGIGPIENLFQVGHYRMLNLVLLVPLVFAIRGKDKVDSRVSVADIAVAGFFCVVTAAHVISDTPTNAVRKVFYTLVDIVAPYYVASRGIRSKSSLAEVIAMYFVAALICAAVAVFENTRFWLLYEDLRGVFDIPWTGELYLMRGGNMLRAKGSLGDPIAMGYVLMVGVAVGAVIWQKAEHKWLRRGAYALLVGGLAATVSRGPWVGAAAAIVVAVVLGPGAMKRVGTAVVVGGASVVAILLSPWGEGIVQYLPFVGSVETGTIDYRQNLLDVSMRVFASHPYFGDIAFVSNPLFAVLYQRGTFVDMVNSYIQIALPYGGVGLAFFLLVLTSSMLQLNQSRRRAGPHDELVARSLLAAMTGIMVTIFTVSTVSAIGPVYWLFAGILVAAARCLNKEEPGARAASPNRVRK